MSPDKNRQILLVSRPRGEPTPADFRLVEADGVASTSFLFAAALKALVWRIIRDQRARRKATSSAFSAADHSAIVRLCFCFAASSLAGFAIALRLSS